MSGDQLNLDAIEKRANDAPSGSRCVCAWQMEQARYIAHAREDVLALVAEVRRLRALMAHPDAVAVAFASGLTLADLDDVGGMPAP